MQSDKTTLVVFSGDLDKVLASFIIATGSAAMGKEVTMFFTFWGLNALRKENAVKTNKGFLERLFEWMMPRGASRLAISNMNMGGLGAWLMKHIMRKKNVASLAEMLELAKELDIKIIACAMSMDVLGLEPEELIDGIEYAGVASYLAEADKAHLNLFV